MRQKGLWWVVAVLVAAGGFTAWRGLVEESRGEAAPGSVPLRCERAVEGQLVSPGTMRRVAASAPVAVDGEWRVTIDVDSQNAMGALVRTSWGCSLDTDSLAVTSVWQVR